MYVSLIIKNVCLFTNVLLLKYMKGNYDCNKICDTVPEGTRDVPVHTRFLIDWLPWIVLICVEIDFFSRHRYFRRNNLMDAAVIVQTILLSSFSLSLLTLERFVYYTSGKKYLDNLEMVCKTFPCLCLNDSLLLVVFTLIFYSTTMRLFVGRFERLLRSWEPDQHAEDLQRQEGRETASAREETDTTEAAASCEEASEPEESSASELTLERNGQPLTSRVRDLQGEEPSTSKCTRRLHKSRFEF